MYFDWVKYELVRGTFGGDVWTTSYRSLDTLDVLSLSGTWQCMEWSQTTTTKTYYWSSSTGTGSPIPKK